jgi:hypothetical protein
LGAASTRKAGGDIISAAVEGVQHADGALATPPTAAPMQMAFYPDGVEYTGDGDMGS